MNMLHDARPSMLRRQARAVIVQFSLFVVLMLPSSVRAECITPGHWSLQQPRVELVFSGNVVGINHVADLGIRVTFDVDRVWKGSVPKRFDLYVWQLDAEMPTFAFAKRYVAFATKMTGPSRQGVGLTDSDALAFRPVDCGALEYAGQVPFFL